MLKLPSSVDRKASGVGMQVLNTEEMLVRKWFCGVQWSGTEAKAIQEGIAASNRISLLSLYFLCPSLHLLFTGSVIGQDLLRW